MSYRTTISKLQWVVLEFLQKMNFSRLSYAPSPLQNFKNGNERKLEETFQTSLQSEGQVQSQGKKLNIKEGLPLKY